LQEFFLWAQALATSSSLVSFPQHDPPTHKHLFNNLILGHARKYFLTTHTLAPFSLASMSLDTTSTFITLHPKSNGCFPFFLEDYELNQDIELSSYSFKLAFQCMPHLSISVLSMMIFNTFGTIFT
jgi:hypothetical protein